MRSTPLCLFVALALGGCSTSLSKYFDSEPETPSVAPDSPYVVGKADLIAGHYELAIDAFTAALAKQPDSIPLLNGLAVADAKLGRIDAAKGYFARALRIDPHSPVTLTNIAYFDLNNGNAGDALPYAQAAVKEVAAQPQARADLSGAVLAALDGNLARAMSTAGGIVAAGPVARSVDPARAVAEATPLFGSQTTDSSAPGATRTVDARASGKIDVGEIAITPLAPQDALTPSAPIALAVADDHAMPGPVATALRVERRSTSPAAAHSGHGARLTTNSNRTGHAPELADAAFRVSNGVGAPRLAGRTAEYLSVRGISVRSVTNETKFGRRYSVIYYDPGLAASAQRLADALPMHPGCVQVSAGSGQVELVLGADALSFAADLTTKPRPA